MKVKIKGIVYAELRPEFTVDETVVDLENEICDLAAEFNLLILLWKSGWIMSKELADYFGKFLTCEDAFVIDGEEDLNSLLFCEKIPFKVYSEIIDQFVDWEIAQEKGL